MARSAKAPAAASPATGASSLVEWFKRPLQLAPLYWLLGSEDFLRQQILRRLRPAVLEEGFADFNHQQLRLSASSKPQQLLDALSELPMMVERRLLEVSQVHELPAKVADQLLGFLAEGLHPGLVVIFSSELPKSKSPLWDWLKQRAQVLSCELETAQRGEFLSHLCSEMGLDLSRPQQQLVLERSGGDLRSLATAVERLKSFCGPEGHLSDGELEQLVQDSAQVQAWRLTDAIGKKDLPRAYTLLHRLLQQEQPQQLISYLNSYLLGLVQVAELQPRLKSAGAIAKELPRRSEFQIRKSLEELATWSASDLANAFERLARADFRIKTGSDPLLMLQLTLVALCHRKGNPKR